MCENFAWVVFKYASSVDDSIKLFQGTTLYGLPITTKSYSKHLEQPVFDEQLNYFKQLVNAERSQSAEGNSNRNRWNDQRSANLNDIPESLLKPPIHHFINFDDDESYSRRSDNPSRYGNSDEFSKYQHKDTFTNNRDQSYGSKHGSAGKSFQGRGRYRRSEHNNSVGSMEMSNYNQDSYHNQNYDNQHQDFNAHSSSHWQENRNQETYFTDDNNSANDVLPARDLRHTMNRKRKYMDSDYHNDTNVNEGGGSTLDLRDTMYHNKNNRYENQGQQGQQHQSDFNNRWSERNKNKRGNNFFSNYDSRNKNNRYQNHYANQSFNQDHYAQEYNNEFPNNYNGGQNYRRDKNKPNNYKYNQMRSQNMESSNRQQSSYGSYKRNNDGYEKKPYANSYNQRGGRGRGKNFNRGNDRSRHSFY